jgi:radical SAM protein with 4Fe4S-binding SPASM domain
MSFEGFPFVIGWELTLACNLRCRHCASSAGIVRENELDLEESLAICDQLPALLVDEVIFTGGEPLLSPHWRAIASRLRSHRIKAGVVTNGVLITDETVDAMKACGITAAGVSLDGLAPAHDALRGARGVFEKTLRGIEHLARGGIDLTLITSVTALNISSLHEIMALVKSLGAWKWQLQPLFPRGRCEGDDALKLTEDQFVALGRFIHSSHDAALQDGLTIVPADSCGYLSSLDLEKFQWSGCQAGRAGCGIMSDGRIKGCLSWPDAIVEGNLREDDLWTIWFRPEAFSQLRNCTPADMKGTCKACDKADDCGGGCQAMSLAATGEWHADPYCYRRILKEQSSAHPSLSPSSSSRVRAL